MKLPLGRRRILGWAGALVVGVLAVSCASLSRAQETLPAKKSEGHSLVALNLYRMNFVVGADVEARFRLVNLSDGSVSPDGDWFSASDHIGSLKLVQVPPGEYQVRFIEFRSIGQGGGIRLNCESSTSTFTVGPNSITYIGNVGIDNGNVDLFTQRYDLIRMDGAKVKEDLDRLSRLSENDASGWEGATLTAVNSVFPDIIRNRR